MTGSAHKLIQKSFQQAVDDYCKVHPELRRDINAHALSVAALLLGMIEDHKQEEAIKSAKNVAEAKKEQKKKQEEMAAFYANNIIQHLKEEDTAHLRRIHGLELSIYLATIALGGENPSIMMTPVLDYTVDAIKQAVTREAEEYVGSEEANKPLPALQDAVRESIQSHYYAVVGRNTQQKFEEFKKIIGEYFSKKAVIASQLVQILYTQARDEDQDITAMEVHEAVMQATSSLNARASLSRAELFAKQTWDMPPFLEEDLQGLGEEHRAALEKSFKALAQLSEGPSIEASLHHDPLEKIFSSDPYLFEPFEEDVAINPYIEPADIEIAHVPPEPEKPIQKISLEEEFEARFQSELERASLANANKRMLQQPISIFKAIAGVVGMVLGGAVGGPFGALVALAMGSYLGDMGDKNRVNAQLDTEMDAWVKGMRRRLTQEYKQLAPPEIAEPAKQLAKQMQQELISPMPTEEQSTHRNRHKSRNQGRQTEKEPDEGYSMTAPVIPAIGQPIKEVAQQRLGAESADGKDPNIVVQYHATEIGLGLGEKGWYLSLSQKGMGDYIKMLGLVSAQQMVDMYGMRDTNLADLDDYGRYCIVLRESLVTQVMKQLNQFYPAAEMDEPEKMNLSPEEYIREQERKRKRKLG